MKSYYTVHDATVRIHELEAAVREVLDRLNAGVPTVAYSPEVLALATVLDDK